MTRARFLLPLLACYPLTACVIGDAGDDPTCTDGKCDGGGVDQTCADPRYGDGTCDLELACAVPDLDCFHTFATDAEAATFFADFERQLAAEENRPPRVFVSESDPRFAKARDLLDRGWAAFASHRPVGELRERRPGLVVLEDPTRNAFVIPDVANHLSAFTVQVQTGLLDAGADDAAMLGVMMHELQHAVGLHLIGDTKDRLRRFYVAPAGDEPIGRDQLDDPTARTAVTTWRTATDQVAIFDNPELGGFPLAGGQLDQIFKTVIAAGVQRDAAACARATSLVDGLRGDLRVMVDPIDTQLAGDLTAIPARVDEALAALRDECLVGFPTFVETVAELSNQTPAQVEAGLSEHDRALVDGRHVIDGIAALAADRRAVMRDTETAFTGATGEPWTAVRFFSTEEDADDTSVVVLRAAHLDPAGEGRALATLLPDDAARARCDGLLAAGSVPAYGIDLRDEHHGTCWRIYHLNADAERGVRMRVRTPRAAAITVRVPARLPLPPRLADSIAY